MSDMNKTECFEFELEGFDGGTDETDNFIKWIIAPDQNIAELVMKALGFKWQQVCTIDVTEEDAGVDMIIRESLFDVSLKV